MSLLSFKFKPSFPYPRHQQSSTTTTKFQAYNPQFTPNRIGFSPKPLRFTPVKRFAINNDDSAVVGLNEAEKESRESSTMPGRFRDHIKEAPETPLKWPWFVALAFLIYAWRAVLFELSNWKNAALGIVRFIGYILKYALALVYRFIGNPITFTIRSIEDLIYGVQTFYYWIITSAPVPELTTVITLASVILAVAETTVPNCISDQPYVLTVTGLIGYAAVRGVISEPLFWTLLVGIYGFSKFIKKRDDVSSAMPVAAVLAAVGEPWVRFMVIVSYTALAIYQYSKKLSERKEDEEIEPLGRKLPVPLFLAALAIGLRVAAKWAGHRHLTWMIV
ncbi:embryo defective [Trifolium repens]|nr:embryo defective [Trifolium repens]